jgi:hypothetical protein
MITRRTTRRHFLLRPDADGTAQGIYWYATAVLARKFGILLHAVQILSTHLHEIITDVHGNLPAFLRERNRLLANALKCHRGWPEEVFQRAPASYVELYGPDAILQKIGYTLANCVEAGLVEHPREWPGVTVDAADIGTRIVRATRPAMYFDPANPAWPATASIRIEMPARIVQTYGECARDVLRAAVDTAISAARASARKAGYVVREAAALCATAIARRARSFELMARRNPTFASGGVETEERAAIEDRARFRSAYRQARVTVADLVPDGGNFPLGSWRWPNELFKRRGSNPQPPRTPPFASHRALSS